MEAMEAMGGTGNGNGDVDGGELAVIARALEAFRARDPDLPIQYALSFLAIARNEGSSIRALAERLGIAQSSASRNVAALSLWHSFGKPGLDLVEAQEDPRERRRKVVILTDKGRALVRELRGLLTAPDASSIP
jgi:DNA-binding MarR family transcriptional regulator